MITYDKFKSIFDIITDYEPEITLVFKNRCDKYMIIKYDKYITFQKLGENNQEIKFNSLDELYNTNTIDDIKLSSEWNNIVDIIFDNTFSVITDKDYFLDTYNIELN